MGRRRRLIVGCIATLVALSAGARADAAQTSQNIRFTAFRSRSLRSFQNSGDPERTIFPPGPTKLDSDHRSHHTTTSG